jgi:N-methylhydantoinase A
MIRIATDVGGTFTDLVAIDEESGRVIQGKALTTPADPAQGVLNALVLAGLEGDVLTRAGFFVHGGTTVINALLQRKGARTAFVTTAGFRDVLLIGRGNRPDLYNLRARSPTSFVPRSLCFEVDERIESSGRIRTPLSLASLEAAAEAIVAAQVEAVAVMFLHSYANSIHEERAAAFLRKCLPAASVVASHEVSRRWREYERGTTTALTADVQPVMARYLANLSDAMRGRGYSGPIYIMQSNAGLTDVEGARRNPLAMVESGPAGGVAGAAHLARRMGGEPTLHLDVGGTTAKCSLVLGAEPRLSADYRIEWSRTSPGHPIQTPVVDIVEIGAGGGSIVRLGPGDTILVGPESAGADPGPACYGRGGIAPTITDAKLLTGVLDPRRFSEGVHLDKDAAREAFTPLAVRLGVNPEQAAEAAISVAESKMISALKLVSVQRGHDPRDMALLVTGGAGPMHAAALGRELGVHRTVIPPLVGLFSAFGMLATAPRIDVARTRLTLADDAGVTAALGLFAELEAEAAAGFDAGMGQVVFRRSADMRYRGQEHTVTVDWPAELRGALELIPQFAAAHQQAYTFRLDGTPVEIVTCQVSATLPLPPVNVAPVSGRANSSRRSRPLMVGGIVEDAVVFDRASLMQDRCYSGPALTADSLSDGLHAGVERESQRAKGHFRVGQPLAEQDPALELLIDLLSKCALRLLVQILRPGESPNVGAAEPE